LQYAVLSSQQHPFFLVTRQLQDFKQELLQEKVLGSGLPRRDAAWIIPKSNQEPTRVAENSHPAAVHLENDWL